MTGEINILEICKADDVDQAKEYLATTGDVNNTVNDKSGHKLTAAWLAAYLGARNVLAFLVRNGADIDYRVNGLAVRDFAIANLQVFLGLLEGGMKPNSAELGLIFLSKFENDVPTRGTPGLMDLAIRSDPEFLASENIARIELFREIGLLEQLVPGLASATATMTQIDHSAVDRLSEEIEAAAAAICDNFAKLVELSFGILTNNLDVFDSVICQRFRGYRKNRKWLMEAEGKAKADISRLLATKYDYFEDDEEFCDIIALALARYPIKERVEGLGQSGIEAQPTGLQFEVEARGILMAAGFDVSHTGASGDQGADLMARKDGLSYAVQCKNYNSPAGNAAVQEVLSAKAFYQADYGVVCAPNGFTKSAKSLASSAGILLVPPTLLHDLDKLRALVD